MTLDIPNSSSIQLGFGLANVRDAFEWSNIYLAIPLSVVGFGLAIWQLDTARKASERAQTAAEAAQSASAKTSREIERSLRKNVFAELVGVSGLLDRELSQLTTDGGAAQIERVLDVLRRWSTAARDLNSLMHPTEVEGKKSIENSIRVCRHARDTFRKGHFEVALEEAFEALEATEDFLDQAAMPVTRSTSSAGAVVAGDDEDDDSP